MIGINNKCVDCGEPEIDLNGVMQFSAKFPNSKLTEILKNSPNSMTAEEFIGAVGVWLNILDEERHNNFGGKS